MVYVTRLSYGNFARLFFVALAFSMLPAKVFAANRATSSEFRSELPTFHSLGFRWLIAGDANQNAKITVRFKKDDAKKWRDALPLHRIESAALEKRQPPTGQTLFAGSILFLQPNTKYQIKLALIDPDGGNHEKVLSLRTWQEPTFRKAKRTIHVAPGDGGGRGTKKSPYKGLDAANAAAQPGDLILIRPGIYPGTLKLRQSGTAKAPITWRGEKAGTVVLEISHGKAGIVASSRQHIFIENITVRGARWGIRVIGAKHITIRRCRLLNVGAGIFGDGRGQERIVILDTEIKGVLPWPFKRSIKTAYSGELRGVDLAGTGHIVAYNTVSHFRDGIDVRPPQPVAGIDIHNNDIFDCYDDGIELDSSEQNVRAFSNRITNTGSGVTFQPILGGPVYVVRNIFHNTGNETFKLHLTPTNKNAKDWRIGPHRTSGGFMLHNTIVRSGSPLRVWSNEGPAHYYFMWNNIFLGIGGTSPIDITIPLRYSNLDYNGYFHGAKIGRFAFLNRTKYQTIQDFAKGTQHEKHGFAMVAPKKGLFVDGWDTPGKTVRVTPRNFLLEKSSPAIDKGKRIPAINDSYTGKAPDLGALEYGDKPPHYGIRPAK